MEKITDKLLKKKRKNVWEHMKVWAYLNFYKRGEIESDIFYEYINTTCYTNIENLSKALNWIRKDNEDWYIELDKWYLFGEDSWNIIGYLTAIVSTYLDKYIRDNAKDWWLILDF